MYLLHADGSGLYRYHVLVIYVPRLYDAQRFTDTVLTKGAKTWFGRERWRSTFQPRRSLQVGKVDEAVHRTKGLQLVSKSLSPDRPDHWLGTINYDMRKRLLDGLESDQWHRLGAELLPPTSK